MDHRYADRDRQHRQYAQAATPEPPAPGRRTLTQSLPAAAVAPQSAQAQPAQAQSAQAQPAQAQCAAADSNLAQRVSITSQLQALHYDFSEAIAGLRTRLYDAFPPFHAAYLQVKAAFETNAQLSARLPALLIELLS